KTWAPLNKLFVASKPLISRCAPSITVWRAVCAHTSFYACSPTTSNGTCARPLRRCSLAMTPRRAQLQLPLKNKSGEGKRPAGRQPLPPELPRVEQIIACTPEQCICGKCGKPTVVIGYETAEQLDREPAQYFVRVLKREK